MSLESNLLGGAQNRATDWVADKISGTKNQKPQPPREVYGGMASFLSRIQSTNGLLRPTMFEVIISDPTSQQFNGKAFSLLCHQASIPGMRIETKDNVIYQLPYETPVGIAFDPFWCTFYVDNDFSVPQQIYRSIGKSIGIGREVGGSDTKDNMTGSWSPFYRSTNMLHVQINVITISNPDTIDINKVSDDPSRKLTDDSHPIISTYVLKNAFVKAVQQVPLDWGSQNAVSSMTMEISYEWFEQDVNGTSQLLMGTEEQLATSPSNFDTYLQKYPALAEAYNVAKDAVKRTILETPQVMNVPILNQVTQIF